LCFEIFYYFFCWIIYRFHEFSFFFSISTFNIKICWEWGFILFFIFDLFSMNLSWSYNQSHEFNKLTKISFFTVFQIDFFYSILQYWTGWKLSFIIFFDLFFMSYPDIITRVNPVHFFSPFWIEYFLIGLYFLCVFYEIISISSPEL